MKIAIIAPHFPEYSLRLAAAIAKAREVVVVVNRDTFGKEFQGLDLQWLPKTCRIVQSTFDSVKEFYRLAAILREFRPTSVHFQEAAGRKKALINLFLAFEFRRSSKILLTVHDPLPHSGNDAASAKKFRMLQKLTRKLANQVAVHGEFCREQLLLAGGVDDEKITVTTHGSLMVCDPSLRPPPSPRTFIMFGRMERYKGLHVLLQAIDVLLKREENFKIKIMGRGDELDKQQYEFSRIPQCEVFNRFIPPLELMGHICSAGIALLPYLDATQSGVLSSVLGNARTAITSDVGGFRDLIQDGRNGRLVPAGNVLALAEAMEDLLARPSEVMRLCAGAAHTAKTTLDWHQIVHHLDQKGFYV